MISAAYFVRILTILHPPAPLKSLQGGVLSSQIYCRNLTGLQEYKGAHRKSRFGMTASTDKSRHSSYGNDLT